MEVAEGCGGLGMGRTMFIYKAGQSSLSGPVPCWEESRHRHLRYTVPHCQVSTAPAHRRERCVVLCNFIFSQ